MTSFIKTCDCSNNMENIKKVLLDLNLNINSVFIKACRENDIKIVKLFLSDPAINVNAVEGSDYTGFIHACFHNNIETVELLSINKRIDVNVKDSIGWTGFFTACHW